MEGIAEELFLTRSVGKQNQKVNSLLTETAEGYFIIVNEIL